MARKGGGAADPSARRSPRIQAATSAVFVGGRDTFFEG
jgi:hypothetical protein